jgi:phthalate 4,5-dioxygenase oxygenase subunit
VLSQQDNELLTRTGPGTPMGNYLRCFWTPVMLESELGAPDEAPVRLKILGESLVAFRDTSGRIGLLKAQCPHRGANLFWGRNEGEGLRCVYHGWKFDVSGQCMDMPNCPEGENLAARVKTPAYATKLHGGLLWAYMGPANKEPAFPDIEIFTFPQSHRYTCKIVCPANYFDLMEGDMDASHPSFLHSRLDKAPIPGAFGFQTQMLDTKPRYTIEEEAYGLRLAAQRDAGPDEYQWRVTQYLLPYVTLISARRGERTYANIRVPIDDEKSINFRTYAHPDRPLAKSDYDLVTPEMIPGTFFMKENIENDFLIDRESQKHEKYTGIKSIVAEDVAVLSNRDTAIVDRTDELLVSSDRAIITLRKRLIRGAKALMDGSEPAEASSPEAYRVRAVDIILPRDVPLAEGAPELYHPVHAVSQR